MALIVTGALSLGTTAAIAALSYPRIGYQNRCRDADCAITTSTADANAEGSSVINGLDWDYWQPTATPGIIAFTFPVAITATYCGIAGHTLTETGNSAELQYWNGSAWVSLGSSLPGSESGNKTIMFLFDSVASTIWRVIVTGGTTTTMPVIGVISIGVALVLERKIYGGHTPINLSKNTTIRPQKSEGGRWLGRSIIRQGASTNVALSNLTAAWVRSDFYPFMESARTYPFFFAWRPNATYADEIAYCWTSNDIKVTNNGKANLMDTSFTIDAIVE